MKSHRFHAWRRLRNLGPSWKLVWSDDLPDDTYGETDFGARTITIRNGLSFEERRCTITHEVEHVMRGPFPRRLLVQEELLVDRSAARLLLPSIRDVADCLVFHHGNYELAAEDLWVDAWMLEVRLSSLHPSERAYLRRRQEEVVLLSVDD